MGSDPEKQMRMPLTSTAYSFSAGQVAGSGNVFPSDSSVGIGLIATVPGNILTVVRNPATDPIADAWTTNRFRRWLTNVETIEDAIGKVKRLRGVWYDRTANGKHEIGVIAEEVSAVSPEVVAFEKNGTNAQSVDYGRLVAVLSETVKEQQNEIEELKTRLNERTAE